SLRVLLACVFRIKMRKSCKKFRTPVVLLVVSLFSVGNTICFPKEALPTESGYLNIVEKPGAMMFYAYYEAINSAQRISNTPILLWLHGGYGCSAMAANFYEIGPWLVDEDLILHRNPASWNRIFGLLFVDNPIGSGFSIAPSNLAIPRTDEEVAEDLYSALQEFFALNPLFCSRPFFVTGESNGGKYVSSLAYYMVKRLDNGEPNALRVDGISIGDGWVDPVTQIRSFASAAHAQGLIDFQQKLYLENLQQQAVSLVRQQKWNEAAVAGKRVEGWLTNVTDLACLLDTRRTFSYDTSENGTDYVSIFLNLRAIKEALRADVNMSWKRCSEAVEKRMHADYMKSTKWKVEMLVKRMPVLLYQGQFDLGYAVSTEEWLRSVEWSGVSEFWRSERMLWKVGPVLAGYVRSHSNLSHVVVARAGHLSAADQKGSCQAMIESWVKNQAAANTDHIFQAPSWNIT
ncbi:hypothetical protein KI387_018579, partial [Taxus chinensis]